MFTPGEQEIAGIIEDSLGDILNELEDGGLAAELDVQTEWDKLTSQRLHQIIESAIDGAITRFTSKK